MAVIKLTVNSNFKEASKDFGQFVDTSDAAQKRMEKLKQSVDGAEFDKFSNSLNRAKSAITATRGTTAGLEQAQYRLRTQIEKMIRGGVDPLDASLTKLQKEYDKTTRQIEINTRAQKLNEDMTKMASRAFLGLIGVIGVGAGASIKFASAIEDATASFTPLLGGVDKATQLVKMLNETAATTPFQFDNISSAAKQLLPVMQGDLKKTVDTFRMLGDTAGGNAQKLESITRGYTKAMLKNKVDMESLNMIAEAGVPIYSELASSMGVSVEEMMKLSSAGKITSDDLTKAFETMTTEGGLFFNGMEIASQTASGKLSTLKDVYILLGATIGDKLLPAWKNFLDIATRAGRAVTAFVADGERLNRLLNIILPLLAGVAGGLLAFLVITKIIAIVKGFTTAMAVLNAVLAANPVILIAVAIAIVIAAIVLLIRNWDKVVVVLGSTVARLQARFEQFGSAISTTWTRAINNLKIVFLELGGIILNKVLGAVNKLLDLASKIPFVGDKFANLQDSVNGFASELDQARLDAIAGSDAAIQTANDEQAAAKLRADAAVSGIKEESAARLSALKEQEEANSKLDTTAPNGAGGVNPATGTTDPSALADRLAQLNNVEAMANQARLSTFGDFLTARMDQEGKAGEERILFLQDELLRIQDLTNVSNEEKLSAEKAVQEKITEIEKKASEERVALRRKELSATGDLFSSLSELVTAYGEDNEAAVAASKALASTSAAINSYLAFTQVLADPSLPFFLKGISAASILASGLAQQKNIWSAETGGSFTVPNSNGSSRVDSQTMRVNPGEEINVTPRGESSGKAMTVNVMVDKRMIWSITQEGLDANEITVSNDNLRAG